MERDASQLRQLQVGVNTASLKFDYLVLPLVFELGQRHAALKTHAEVQRASNSEMWVNEQIGFKEDPAAGIRPPEVNEEGAFFSPSIHQ